MNGNIKIVAIGSACFVFGWLGARARSEQNFKKVLNEELREFQRDYEEQREIQERRWQQKYDDFVAGQEAGELSLIQAIVSGEAKIPTQPEDDALTSYQGVQERVDYTQYAKAGAPVEGSVLGPQKVLVAVEHKVNLITEEDFVNADKTYVITYYAGDDTLATLDGFRSVIGGENRAGLLGELDGHLMEFMNSEGNVFVQNDGGEYAVQIIVDDESFGEVAG